MSGFKKKTAVNIGFTGMAVLAVSALHFLTTIVLGRILLPTDYGIVGFALIFVNFMATFSDFGIGSALIQKADIDDDTLCTGLALRTLFGALAFILLFSLAPVSRFFNDSREITSAIRLLSFGFLVSILGFLPQVMLTRELRFRELSFPQVLGAIANSFCAIALAHAGFGFRSIIFGTLMNNLIVAVLFNLIRPVRFRLRFKRRGALDILRFGSHLLVPGVIIYLIMNADNFAIGAFRNSEQLGYYAMAFNLGSLICVLLAGIFHQVLFPTFSKFQHDLKTMKAAYLESVKYISFLAVPVNLFLMVLGSEFLLYVIGGGSARWLPALAAFRVLCVYGVLRALLEPLGNVTSGIGKPRLLIKPTLLVAVLQIGLLYPALRFGGIEGVALVVTASYASQYFIYLPILKREIGVTAYEVYETMRPAALAFVSSLPVVILLKWNMGSSLFSLTLHFLTGISLYFIIYGVLTKWQIVEDLRWFLRSSRRAP